MKTMMVSVAAYVSWNPTSKRRLEDWRGAGRKALAAIVLRTWTSFQRASAEEGQGHERGPEDRRTAFDEHGVEDEEDGQGEARRPAGHANEAKQRKEQQVDDGDVAAGDGEEMIEAGLLEVVDGRLVQPSVFAEEPGLGERPRRRRCPPSGAGTAARAPSACSGGRATPKARTDAAGAGRCRQREGRISSRPAGGLPNPWR